LDSHGRSAGFDTPIAHNKTAGQSHFPAGFLDNDARRWQSFGNEDYLMARGHIRQRSPGSWQIVVYVGVDPDGKSRYKSETVRGPRRDAEERLNELIHEIRGGAHHGPDRTVNQLLDYWIDARLGRLAPSSQASVMVHIDRYLRPQLGHLKLSRLEVATIEAFYGRLARQGVSGRPLSDTYVRRIHASLRSILASAEGWGWIARNPAILACPGKGERFAPEPPDVADVRRLIEEADRVNPAFGAYLRVAAAAGPRRGELAALRRSDIDWDRGEIVFRRSVTFNAAGGVTVKPYTKTRGQRRISLDPFTLATLKTALAAQAERAILFGVPLDHDPWVFSFAIPGDTPPRPDAFTRAFMRIRDRLGLKVRLHDLRHYHATSLLTAGVDVRTVAGRLGHANPNTTLNVYAAWQPAADRKASDIAAGLLG
jgi:integrase